MLVSKSAKSASLWIGGANWGVLTSSEWMHEWGVGLWDGRSCGCSSRWGRWRLLGFADFGVALGKLQPDGLRQVRIKADPLLQEIHQQHVVKALLKSGNWQKKVATKKFGKCTPFLLSPPEGHGKNPEKKFWEILNCYFLLCVTIFSGPRSLLAC